jgi:hypothetical protein
MRSRSAEHSLFGNLQTQVWHQQTDTRTIAYIGIPLWMMFWPDESGSALILFWGLFAAMLVRARVESAWRFARGHVIHSRHSGDPWLACVFKRTPEWRLKGEVEPVLLLVVGIFLLPVSEPLFTVVGA